MKTKERYQVPDLQQEKPDNFVLDLALGGYYSPEKRIRGVVPSKTGKTEKNNPKNT